jgi:protein-S-isoprenylcysteine O-methyltransferase Ste14
VDAFRYGLALVLLCTLPPMLFFWPVVHGFIGFWRRIGPAATYAVTLSGAALGGIALYRLRSHLLAVDLGTCWLGVAAGSCCLVVAAWLRARLQRDVTIRLLSGLPELAPPRHPQALVRTGLYARIRHPRYVQFSIALLGYALIANYPAIYAIWLLWLPGILVVARFEERELRQRFGREYDDYAEAVPRFAPRWPGRASSADAGRSRAALFLKNLLFTVVVPGSVAVYLPWWIGSGHSAASGAVAAALRWVSLLPLAAGGSIYLWCLWDFAAYGRGTPAPIDAPRRLVVRGLYRYVRNPMYVGVLLAILGWTLHFASPVLLLYAAVVALAFHGFVVAYEEPTLRRVFGADYRDYAARVPRWIPRLRGDRDT